MVRWREGWWKERKENLQPPSRALLEIESQSEKHQPGDGWLCLPPPAPGTVGEKGEALLFF